MCRRTGLCQGSYNRVVLLSLVEVIFFAQLYRQKPEYMPSSTVNLLLCNFKAARVTAFSRRLGSDPLCYGFIGSRRTFSISCVCGVHI